MDKPTAEQIVKLRFPQAYAWWSPVAALFYVKLHRDYLGGPSGYGETEEEAWSDAASRITKEGK